MKKCKADVKRTASAFIHFLGHQSILDHIMIKFWDNIEKIQLSLWVVGIKVCR